MESTDDALRSVAYLTFDSLYSLHLKSILYSEVEELSEQWQHVLTHGRLSYVFYNMLDFVVAVLNITRPSPPRPTVIVLDDDIMPLKQLAQQVPLGTPLYANRVV